MAAWWYDYRPASCRHDVIFSFDDHELAKLRLTDEERAVINAPISSYREILVRLAIIFKYSEPQTEPPVQQDPKLIEGTKR